MNGPEHYAEAERLLSGDELDLAAAQVHATLALAAATAESGVLLEPSAPAQWREAIR